MTVSAEMDVVDLHFREALPMSLLLCVVLPTLHLEDDDLVAPAVTHDLRDHLRLCDCRHARFYILAVVAEQHVGELDRAAGIAHEGRQPVFLARLDAELASAGADDSVGHL